MPIQIDIMIYKKIINPDSKNLSPGKSGTKTAPGHSRTRSE